MKLRLLVAVLAVAGFVQLTPRASADMITLQLDRTVPGSVSVNLNGNNINNVFPGPYYWSDVNLPPNGSFPSPITTFCAELTDTVTRGESYVFGIVTPDKLPSIGNNPTKISNIKALYGNFYQAGWQSNSFNGSTESTAFQLALWNLIYDTDSNVTSGAFRTNFTGATTTRANQMLGGLNGGLNKFNASGLELVGLIAPVPGKTMTGGQDQLIVRAIPAPPAVLLAGVGVLALIGRARFTRRPTAAV